MSMGGRPAARSIDAPRRHVPGLDGLRGLAVIAVLLYHAEVLRGGFLGVDAFFVLSGFLITGLLIDEVGASGRVALGAFWARRVRRLLPALLGLLVGVAAFAVFVAHPSDLAAIRGDVFAALAYVSNWRAIAGGHGYWQMFQDPSPLEHAWSLAVEEQFYVVWPLLVGGLTWLLTRRATGDAGRRVGRALFVGSAVGAAVSAFAMWHLYVPGSDPSRVYMGTDTRAASILVGAALAGWVGWRGRPAARWTAARVVLEAVAVIAVAGLGVAWSAVGGQTPRLYQGGFLVVSLAAVVVLAAVSHPVEGPVARVMSWTPLRWAGTISYGTYLWHWPVYLVLTEERTGISGHWLVAVRLVVALVFGVLSYVVVESPIRTGRLRRLQLRLAVPVGVITCAGLVALATAGAVPNRTTVLLASQSSSASGGGAVAAGPAGAAPGLPTVLVVGDSVANSIASGAQTWGGAMHVSVANGAVNGCALTDEITGLQLLKKTERNEVQLNAPCAPTWLGTFERVRPAAVAIVFGNAAGFERFRLGGAWVGACDAAYARWYGTEMAQMVSTFRGGGATVTMATLPYPDAPWLPPDARQRIDCMNGLIRGAATRAGVAVVDLGRFVCPAGRCVVEHGGEPVRSDGVHFGRPVDGDGTKGFSGDGSRFVGRWLLQEVLDHGTGARRA